jgi:hypothetical protein
MPGKRVLESLFTPSWTLPEKMLQGLRLTTAAKLANIGLHQTGSMQPMAKVDCASHDGAQDALVNVLASGCSQKRSGNLNVNAILKTLHVRTPCCSTLPKQLPRVAPQLMSKLHVRQVDNIKGTAIPYASVQLPGASPRETQLLGIAQQIANRPNYRQTLSMTQTPHLLKQRMNVWALIRKPLRS